MPTISTGQELLAALGAVVNAPDPIDELRARGYTFSPQLAQRIDTPEAHARLRGPERQGLLNALGGLREPRLQSGALVHTVANLPGGHHDLTIGLKLEKVNEVLADIYAKRTLLRLVPLDSGPAAGSADALLPVLRAELVGLPQNVTLRIGRLRLTGPLTVTALPTPPSPTGQPDTTARLLVHLPFSLEIDSFPLDGGPGQLNATRLNAVAHFGVSASARVEGNGLNVVVGAMPGQIGLLDPGRLRLTIDASSPLPPKNANSGDLIGQAIEMGGFQQVLRDMALSTTLTPRFTLPIGHGFDLHLRHIDLRAVPSAGAGHLMIGLEIGAEPLPTPLNGRPELLERDPFDAATGSSLYVEAHAELFRVFTRLAFESGELERIARESFDNVRITGADADLDDNGIGIRVRGKLVNECGIFGTGFVDVDFDGWARYRLAGVSSNQITFEQVEDIGVGDAGPLDVAACLLLSFLDLKILVTLKTLLEAAFSKLSHLMFGAPAPATIQFLNLFDPNFPIPRTELLPRARVLGAKIDIASMQIQAALDLVPDNFNTYVYVLCVTEGNVLTGGGQPLAGVSVRLFDQDVPPPAGDDANIPELGTTEGPVGHNRWRTIDVSFQAPSADQELASGTTDREGRVQLVVPRNRYSYTAGVVTKTTTVEHLHTGEVISQQTSREAVVESRPDLYMLLQVPNRPVRDTRAQGGFAPNFSGTRWGTPEQPLKFRVPRPLPIVDP